MQFEWDKAKNEFNYQKHGICFEEAVEIFENPILSWSDDRHDYKEQRIISIGNIDGVIVLAVVHTSRGEKIRIISARKANQRERKKYYEYLKKAT